MTLTVTPGQVAGTTRAPPSKSVTHRALVLGLLAGGGRIEHPLIGADTQATIDAIESFGATVDRTDDGLTVTSSDLRPATIDAANSGTTLRIATAVATLCAGTSRIDGDASLRGRPMGPLAAALERLGATVTCEGADDTPPVEVIGPATGDTTVVDASVSSQFVTALCLIAPRLPRGLTIDHGSETVSWPYVEVTLELLESVGVSHRRGSETIHVPAQSIDPVDIVVPGDYSGAAFPLVAGAMTGGRVVVEGLARESTQGDARIVDILGRFGVPIERDGTRVIVDGPPSRPAAIDLGATPDLFPPLSALAAGIEGTTELTGAAHLRAKESDRIAAMVEGLTALGIDATPLSDGARITGGSPTGGTVDSADDHRVQMALAVVGLSATAPVRVTGRPDAYRVSYPGFLDMLAALGAEVSVDG